jgi:hypothetical protein
MRCEDVTTQLADYLAGTLTDEMLDPMREHLTTCASCRDEVEAIDDTWQMLGSVAPERPDSTAMRARFDATIAGYRHRVEEDAIAPRRLSSWWQPRWAVQVASAAAMLLIGILVGRGASAPPVADPQIAALRAELGDMRQMVTLSLLQQQSASERLRGVTFTGQIPQPGSEVVTALLDTLMHDQNVNVRLASIDALKRFAQHDAVRRGAVEALPLQTSPLVQIALIDFAVETAGRDSTAALRRLAQDTMLDAAVRARASRGLQQLGAAS